MELNFDLYRGDWAFQRENQRIGRGLTSAELGKNYQKWEGGVSPCETHLDLLTGAH